MGVSRGKNNGVSGALSVLVDGAGTNPTFAVEAKSHSGGISYRPKSRRGRGSAGAPNIRITGLDGVWSVTGKCPLTGWPVPANAMDYSGTLTLVMQTVATTPGNPPTAVDKVDLPVRVTKVSLSFNDGDGSDQDPGEDLWDFAGECTLNGLPVFTWQGTRITVGARSASTQETYEGLQKTYDINGLATGAVQRIDCDGVGDDDLSESTQILAAIAAATSPPLPNLKIVSVLWQRELEDSFGGSILITWGLQDSKDAVETPENVWFHDANNIDDVRSLCQVWDSSGSAPAAPATPSGLKARPYVDRKLNDQKMSRRWEWRRTDTSDDALRPYKKTHSDPFDLEPGKTSAVLWDPHGSAPSDPSIPSGLQLRFKDDLYINDYVTLRIYTWAKNTTQDDLLLPRITSNIDPNGLRSRKFTAALDGTPADPGAPYKLRDTYTVSRTPDHVLKVAEYGLTDTIDDVVLPKTTSNIDPQGLRSKKSVAALNASPTAPSSPYKLRDTFTVKLDDGNTLNVGEYGLQDTVDEILNARALAYRSAQTPSRDRVPAIIAASGSLQSQADSLWNTFRSSSNAFGLELTQVIPQYNLAIYEYLNPGIQVEGYGTGGSRVVDAQLDGSGNVQLYVVSNRSRGSGNREVIFSRYRIGNKPLRRFVIRRLYIQAAPMPDFASLIGQVNDSTSFLGLSIGTAMYDGPVFSTNIALSGSLPFFMGYQFTSDDNGWFSVPDSLFHREQFLATSTTTQQDWVLASDLGVDGMISQPDQGDFSGFVS